MQFPLQDLLVVSTEHPWTYIVFGLIGFGFGFTLEMSGFGNSRKLAAQFYFTELTVLKVMFTAIVTAMVLLFGAVGLGILDFNLVWVNPTYLASGILGGLIMGIGFIIGGFCPTTSLASASTGKIDGMLFILGGFVGAFLFGETEKYFDSWWNYAGYYGRVTLMDIFNLPAGIIVLLVVLMALFMFWGSEQLERIIGKRDLKKEPKLRLVGAIALILVAVGVIIMGQPSTAEKWAQIAPEKEPALAGREVQIHPGELLATLEDRRLQVVLLDVRSEAEYNLFHIRDAVNIPLASVSGIIPDLHVKLALNLVFVVMSNDEGVATEAWKILVAEKVPNVYILEGGINYWLSIFGTTEAGINPTPAPPGNDSLQYTFTAALGDRYDASDPNPHEWELEYEPKIKLEIPRDKSGGGCG